MNLFQKISLTTAILLVALSIYLFNANKSLKTEVSSLKTQNEMLMESVKELGSVAGVQVTANLTINNKAVLGSLKVGDVNALLTQTVSITKDSVLSEMSRLEKLKIAANRASAKAMNKTFYKQ